MEKEKTKTQVELEEVYSRRIYNVKAISPNPELINNNQVSRFIAELFDKVNSALSEDMFMVDNKKARAVKVFVFDLLTMVCAYGLERPTSMATINNIISDFVKKMNETDPDIIKPMYKDK